MENNNNQFLQFSDQLRHQTSGVANLSLNDSIWSNSYATKRPGERRNFDIRVGGDVAVGAPPVSNFNLNPSNGVVGSDRNSSSFNDGWNSFKSGGSDFNAPFNDGWNSFKPKAADLNSFNDWKIGNPSVGINGGFNKGIYSSNKSAFNHNIISNDFGLKSHKKGGKNEDVHGGKGGKKSGNGKKSNGETNSENKESKSSSEKRFKTLPPSESLPRNETVGGYIFVCNNDTMQENLKRQLFGLPPRYRDSVRAITPGLPLFLYNYSTHQLHGIFEAASFGGSNIDPTAWEDKKCPGESRFPAQVRVITRKICEPLEEDSFRPILHHYDGPKFRLELNVPEALSLLDIFADQDA